MSQNADASEQRRIECEEDLKNPEPFEYGAELQQYFPPNYRFPGFECHSRATNEEILTLGAALYSAEESPIWSNRGFNRGDRHFITRISFLPWRGQSHFFRAEVHGETIIVTGKRMSGRGGIDYGEVESVKTITLTDEQSRLFLTTFRRVQSPPFWDFQFIRYASLDGTSIYMETTDSGGYHVLSESQGSFDALDDLALLYFKMMDWTPHSPRT